MSRREHEAAAPRARQLWQLFEPLHALTYFSPACIDALSELGLKGYWMGYFASRSAPLGTASPAVVQSTFFGFAPARVRRALPDAWSITTPAAVLRARADAASITLHQICPDIDELTRRALPLLESAAAAARADGRALAAANQAVEPPEEPTARLWQAATTLREHRGDGHVCVLTSAALSGLEANVVAAAVRSGDDPADRDAAAAQLRDSRGWTEPEWSQASHRLIDDGLLQDDGAPTAEGALLMASIEAQTDQLAIQPFLDGLTATGIDLLATVLRPITTAIGQARLIPYPNPMGLTPPGS